MTLLMRIPSSATPLGYLGAEVKMDLASSNLIQQAWIRLVEPPKISLMPILSGSSLLSKDLVTTISKMNSKICRESQRAHATPTSSLCILVPCTTSVKDQRRKKSLTELPRTKTRKLARLKARSHPSQALEGTLSCLKQLVLPLSIG